MTPARNLLAFLVLLALILLGQWQAGAYQAEFLQDPDESAHYVTGLMVHDYLAAGLPWPPMDFARRFHQHYPRVGLGHWPPFFYIVESAWMLAAGVDRTSILLLVATIAALWAVLCLNLFQRFLGPFESWLAVLFMLATPEVLRASRMVMTEILIALLTLAAIWALHKLFEQPGWRWSVAFGLIASAAILTKGTGVLLAPLPILAALTLRRWDLLKSPWFWLPGLIVAALCGPWYAFAPYALHEKAAPFGGPRLRQYRILEFIHYWSSQLSWAGLALAFAGWSRTALRIFRGEEKSPFWTLILWIIPAAWGFHLIIGAWHPRHLVTLSPVLLLFAAVGARWISASLLPRPRVVAGIVAALALYFAVQHVAANRHKSHRGFDIVAQRILQDPDLAGKRLLVVSDSAGEGAFVAEVAMRDKRLGRTVQRGYQDLTVYGTNGRGTIGRAASPRFMTPEETMNHFREHLDTVLILDSTASGMVNGKLVGEMLAKFPSQWRELFQYQGEYSLRFHQKVLIRVFVPVDVLAH